MSKFEVRPSTIDPPSKSGQTHIDEIVADGWFCHIEQMTDEGYMLMFNKGGDERIFWLGSKTGRAAVVLYETT